MTRAAGLIGAIVIGTWLGSGAGLAQTPPPKEPAVKPAEAAQTAKEPAGKPTEAAQTAKAPAGKPAEAVQTVKEPAGKPAEAVQSPALSAYAKAVPRDIAWEAKPDPVKNGKKPPPKATQGTGSAATAALNAKSAKAFATPTGAAEKCKPGD